MSPPRPAPAGRRVLVVSRHDVRHPGAGAAERYLYEVSRRWVADGAEVTWLVTGRAGGPTEERVAGVRVLRAARPLGAVARLIRGGDWFDVVLTTSGRSAGALRLLTGRPVPVVEVVHRVRRRAVGRLERLLGSMGRWSRTARAVVALSPSARHDLRRRHRRQGPIFIVPPGAAAPALVDAGQRADVPTVVVDVDMVAEERIDLLIEALPTVVAALPGLRVEVLGDGPELARLRRLVGSSRLVGSVTLHGPVTDDDRDRWLRRAWLTVCTGEGEVCGSRLLTAAAYGVPAVVLAAPGARDFLRAGRTGEVVDSAGQLPATLIDRLTALRDEEVAHRVADLCRAWAARFTWERTAGLLAGVVEHQIRMVRSDLARRRSARSDIATLVRLPEGGSVPADALRPTDEVATVEGQVSVLLNGCDEFDALGVLARLGVTAAQLRLAGHDELLIGPHPLPPALAGRPLTFDRS
ncbi:glycosyltransferase family 4 protein [Micromonospora eburnea]|uniref:Glycosyltransferase involved in cell wall bisynthesis n=1 Tax=Micromonospora eburnea TaxID=227316 RepID=A0A1C6VKJ1_9ACTN|nr:glycosyltransferase family 4 protein [Micromonospora eburnea]SCL66614.1 Glycosyltransferase involved in cell wall bisynthesis [Micromonospora eburnea]